MNVGLVKEMPMVEDYRGTKEFYLVLKECIEAAQHRDKLYYGDIADLMPGVPDRGNKMADETGSMSGAVSKEMHEHGHPMISALIVRVSDEKPGPGFYQFAYELGKLDAPPDELSDTEKEAFWEEELEEVYEFWD